MDFFDCIINNLISTHGLKEECKKGEAPLLEVDEQLQFFAKKHGMKLSKNYHNWPERSLTWSEKRIHKLIQIWLENEKEMTFSLWICASMDKRGKRYWKNTYLTRGSSFSDIQGDIEELLKKSMRVVDSWNETDLQLVTDLE